MIEQRNLPCWTLIFFDSATVICYSVRSVNAVMRMKGIAEGRLIMHELHDPLRTVQNDRTLADRRAAGREHRTRVPRSSHAEWTPAADRPDPLSLLVEQNRSRLAHLVPLRYQRMIVSPFTFLRGSAISMAQDLATTP